MFRASQRAAGRLPAAAAALACLSAGVTPAAPLSAAVPPATWQIAGVIPAPASVTARADGFVLRDGARISVSQDPEAARIAAYFAQLLRASHGIALRVQARGGARLAAAAIVFRLDGAAPQREESYRLEVSRAGVLVTARAPRGLFYGAVTLWQLCSARRLQGSGLALQGVSISDAPRFPWRGLMLDSARHFQSPAFISRYIDWMALHKLNVLGWHLTDDQGWRLEIKKYPRLTSVGAWRVPAGRAAQRDLDPATGQPRRYGGFYTQAQVRRIVAHAAARYVTIVPEIDVPGHATAALVAYPQLAASPNPPRAVPADWGIYPNLFNVEDSTFAFLEDVLAEVTALFPGAYINVGGDEAVKDQWRASARVQARMHELGIADEAVLQGYFTQRLGAWLQRHGRRLIGWDEILAGGVPADAAVLSWRGVDGAIAAAASGHDAVLSPAPTLYLDNRQGSAPQEPPGRGTVVSLADVYRFDPLPAPLAALGAHVLGVQANLWTEHVRTEARAAYMTWPRAAALAEVGWSAPARRDWDDFLMRLPAEFARYRTLGIEYSADVFAPPRVLGTYDRRMSQDLQTCRGKLVLNLEGDAPLSGPRAVYLIDIEDPCWQLPAADLTGATRLTAAVGRVPFNFQLGHERDAIRLEPPRSPAGELEVRVDGCDGEPVAVLSLAPAATVAAVTVLPAAPLPHLEGRHQLCLRFTQRTLDPLWAIDWVQLSP